MKQGAVDALTQKAPSSEAIQRATKTGSAKVRFLVADENNWEALLDVRRAILRNSAEFRAMLRNSAQFTDGAAALDRSSTSMT